MNAISSFVDRAPWNALKSGGRAKTSLSCSNVSTGTFLIHPEHVRTAAGSIIHKNILITRTKP